MASAHVHRNAEKLASIRATPRLVNILHAVGAELALRRASWPRSPPRSLSSSPSSNPAATKQRNQRTNGESESVERMWNEDGEKEEKEDRLTDISPRDVGREQPCTERRLLRTLLAWCTLGCIRFVDFLVDGQDLERGLYRAGWNLWTWQIQGLDPAFPAEYIGDGPSTGDLSGIIYICIYIRLHIKVYDIAGETPWYWIYFFIYIYYFCTVDNGLYQRHISHFSYEKLDKRDWREIGVDLNWSNNQKRRWHVLTVARYTRACRIGAWSVCCVRGGGKKKRKKKGSGGNSARKIDNRTAIPARISHSFCHHRDADNCSFTVD